MPSVLQHGSGAGLPAIRFDAGIALLVEGESTGKLYILIAGEVEVLRGDTRVMVANQPGAIFGAPARKVSASSLPTKEM